MPTSSENKTPEPFQPMAPLGFVVVTVMSSGTVTTGGVVSAGAEIVKIESPVITP
jgi:hypothetical protein